MARQRILPDWISVVPGSPEPLYRQISRQIECAVHEGRLLAGTYLPASRNLARHLGVSRITVLNAYELLVADGLLETRNGSGTRVSEDAAGGIHRRTGDPIAKLYRNDLWDPPARPAESKNGPLAFRPGTPALDMFPRQVWSRMLRRQSLRADRELLDYNNQCGYTPLREMIARYLLTSRGVCCHPSQVIVVTSTRTAISLACFVLTSNGDTAALGFPGYYRAQTSFELSGLKPVQVPVDAEGLCVDELTRRSPGARVVHVTPCHDWPTGVPLSSERRQDLLAWAQRQNAWILEDDYDSGKARPLSPTDAGLLFG
jgi:GntR family transcriptional regulator/MocR family aminotransferase